MTTTYVPELGQIPVSSTQTGIVNLPPKGTLIRATLGESSIVGKCQESGSIPALSLSVVGTNYATVTLWLSDGWQFEIVDAVEG